MTLDYGTPARSTVSTHDQIYTTLLGVLSFFLLMVIVLQGFLMFDPLTTSDSRWGLLTLACLEGLYLLAIVGVMVIRIAFPLKRRWPTVGMNVVLLAAIPFGTALGIYGFWKVDKKLGLTEAVEG